ncbi:MAG: hypothetical protein ACRC8S_11030 [Fimbriiglobus sp.]
MLRCVAIVSLILFLAPSAWAQKKKQIPPQDGAIFKLDTASPKWATADLELRDAKGDLWPSFVYGKPAQNGTFTWDAKKPKADFALVFDRAAQKNGDQSRRVLAQVSGTSLPVKMEVTELGEMITIKDEKNKNTPAMPAKGAIVLGGRTVPLTGQATYKWFYPKDAEFPDSILLTLKFSTSGESLGLGKLETVQIQANLTAYLNPTAARK